METLNHGLELYRELLPKYQPYFESNGMPSFGNCLWQLLVNENWKNNKPHCFVQVYNEGLVLGIAEQGEQGYYNSEIHFINSISYKQAGVILDKLNEEMFGLSTAEQARIILSSLAEHPANEMEGDD